MNVEGDSRGGHVVQIMLGERPLQRCGVGGAGGGTQAELLGGYREFPTGGSPDNSFSAERTMRQPCFLL